jgi:uncharacterized phage protein (TIGR01671 family)
MNREIKFRGKSKKTDKWIYGYYFKNRGIDFIAPDEFANGKTWEDYEVDSDSVMQFTGRYDKNNKEVYEGDVLRFYDEDIPSEVVFAFVDGALMAVYTSALDVRSSWPVNDMVIIGNIHDNPELLKGGAE